MRVSAGLDVADLSGKMRIHTLPPRFRWWVMVRRAASIWRAVIHAGSSACKPSSPNVTTFPELARPRIRPRWTLRYLTRFGWSIFVLILVLVLVLVLARVEAHRGVRRDHDFFLFLDNRRNRADRGWPRWRTGPRRRRQHGLRRGRPT